MAKTLVIPNASYSSVALDTVEWASGGDVPCTGIELNNTAPTFEKVGDMVQLTATLTPSNTTDTLSWASSNDNVASVEAGLITIHGIGTATITATCGSASATVTIAQTSIKPQYGVGTETGRYPEEQSTTGGTILKTSSGTGTMGFGQEYHNNDKLRIMGGGSGAVASAIECVPVPYGATLAKVKTTDDTTASVSYAYIVNSESLVEYNSKSYPLFVEKKTSPNFNTGVAVSYGQAIVLRPTPAQYEKLSYLYFE